MANNLNIFIDFSIIQNSNPKKLRDEFELLIQFRNQIFIWSRTATPEQMRAHCLSIKFPDMNEKELNLKVRELRKNKKSYKEISEETKVPVWKLGYYLGVDPNKIWTLDDWIKNYHKKDSSIFPKADFIIDPDQKFVDRFQIAGVDGNCIQKIS